MKKYDSKLNLIETEKAIKFIKDTFEDDFSKILNLTRVSAPLMVTIDSGLNDHLSGSERPVSFDIKHLHKEVEIVQSLAKWKRMALNKYHFEIGTGLYTDMNAIRRDEVLDNIHSIYVDQWDWELIITKENRNLHFLKEIVDKIYNSIKILNKKVKEKYPVIETNLPDDILFISTKELESLYPNLSRKERENEITKKYGAVFIHGIGWNLSDNKPHDSRAADYDDWNLNGDILLWNETLGIALEISSMGIRVDHESILKQLEAKNEMHKINNPYVKNIINNNLPLTIGGGIGQSRLCMHFLNKIHIGEVQASIWDEDYLMELEKNNIKLL